MFAVVTVYLRWGVVSVKNGGKFASSAMFRIALESVCEFVVTTLASRQSRERFEWKSLI